MNTEKKPFTIKETILNEIHSGKVAMRPKFFFSLKVIATAFVASGILLVSIFILNFILFSIRVNSHDSLLGFGPRGVGTFLHFFPWGLLIADIIFLVVLERLLRQFRFGYKIPTLILFGSLILLSGVLATLLDRETPMNDRLFAQSRMHLLPPPMNALYAGARHLPPSQGGVHKGIVSSVATSTFTIRFIDEGGETNPNDITVFLPPRASATTTGLQIGDTVLVAGDEEGATLYAFGMRILQKSK